MTTTPGVPTSAPQSEPLALHIRSLRQWYGERGLSQKELAELAGISTRALKRYESCRTLPRGLECLIAVALVLEVPPERLLDPRLLEQLSEAIAARRAERSEVASV